MASLTPRTLSVEEMENIGGAAEVERVICQLGIDVVGCNAFADVMASVACFVYHNHLIFPAFRTVSFELAVFFYFTYTNYAIYNIVWLA